MFPNIWFNEAYRLGLCWWELDFIAHLSPFRAVWISISFKFAWIDLAFCLERWRRSDMQPGAKPQDGRLLKTYFLGALPSRKSPEQNSWPLFDLGWGIFLTYFINVPRAHTSSFELPPVTYSRLPGAGMDRVRIKRSNSKRELCAYRMDG